MGFIDKLKAKKMKEDTMKQKIAEKLAEKENRENAAIDKNIQLLEQSGIEDRFRTYVAQVNQYLDSLDRIWIEDYKSAPHLGFSLGGINEIDFLASPNGLIKRFCSDGKRDHPWSCYYYATNIEKPLELDKINEKYIEKCVKWVMGKSFWSPTWV